MDVGASPGRNGLQAHWVVLLLVVATLVGCSGEPFAFDAEGPFSASPADGSTLDRVAFLVTITNRSGDDLQINPADFVARDGGHRVYTANAAATAADARRVGGPPNVRGAVPLPSLTLRGGDVLSGLVLFDLPAGVKPTELIWRQTDRDYVANLAAAP
jgi:hypothetical protein